MDKHIINDEFLYKYMKNTENIIIESLLKEEELSHKFSKKFEKKMDKLIRQEKRTPFMRAFINYSKRVAVIFLIFVTIAFATTMSVGAYRVKFFEIVTEVWEEFTSIIFKSKDHTYDNNKLIPAIPEYIPKGFSILEESTNDHLYRVIYIRENNKEIFYEQRVLSYGEIILDTENIETEVIEIANQTVTLFTSKGVNQIYWNDDSYSYTLISSINNDEVIKIVKGILEKDYSIDVIPISGTIHLEKYSFGRCTNVTSWSFSGTSSVFLSKSYRGTSGTKYRTRVVATIDYEMATATSGSCEIK